MSDGFDDLGRYYDWPDYPAAHVGLVDALRDYIRANEGLRDDLLREGGLTVEQAREGDEHIDRCRALLKEIENWEFDPSLCGVIRGHQTKGKEE
jgi:hypothetical protein